MIIEFAGMPGAGKSTLVGTARETLAHLGYFPMASEKEAGPYCLKRSLPGRLICRAFPQRWHQRLLWGTFRRLLYWHRLTFAIQQRRLTRHVLRHLWKKNLTLRDKLEVLDYYLHISSFYQYFSERLQPGEVLILEEGLVHRATSIHAAPDAAPCPADVLEYLELIPGTALAIFVRASREVCAQRVQARGQQRRYLGEHLVPYLANVSEAIDLAISGLQESGRPVVIIENDGSLEAGRKELQQALTASIQGEIYEGIDHPS